MKDYKERITDLEREVTSSISNVDFSQINARIIFDLFNTLITVYCIYYCTLSFHSSFTIHVRLVVVCPGIVARSKRNDQSYARTSLLIKSYRSIGWKSAMNSRNNPLKCALRWTTWNLPSLSKTRRLKTWCIINISSLFFINNDCLALALIELLLFFFNFKL